MEGEEWGSYPWEGRAAKYHRAEIRNWCGFRDVTRDDMGTFKRGMIDEAIPIHNAQALAPEMRLRTRASSLRFARYPLVGNHTWRGR